MKREIRIHQNTSNELQSVGSMECQLSCNEDESNGCKLQNFNSNYWADDAQLFTVSKQFNHFNHQFHPSIFGGNFKQQFKIIQLISKLTFALISKIHQEQHAKFMLQKLLDATNLQNIKCCTSSSSKHQFLYQNDDIHKNDDKPSSNASASDEEDDEEIERLSKLGISGVLLSTFFTEWDALYGVPLEQLLMYAGLSSVQELLGIIRGIRITGKNANARCFIVMPNALQNFFADNFNKDPTMHTSQLDDIEDDGPPSTLQKQTPPSDASNNTFDNLAAEAIKETLDILKKTLLTQASALEILSSINFGDQTNHR